MKKMKKLSRKSTLRLNKMNPEILSTNNFNNAMNPAKTPKG